MAGSEREEEEEERERKEEKNGKLEMVFDALYVRQTGLFERQPEQG